MRRLVFLLLAGASLSFGQLDSNSVTIRASRELNLQPDLGIVGVSVTSKLSTGLDEVLAGLQGTGISSANFVGVNSFIRLAKGTTPVTSLLWFFSVSVPFGALKNTVAALSTVQGNISGQSSGLTIEFSVDGSEVSPQLLAAQTCPIPDLIAEVRTQARKLTDAAGMGLGPILALSDSPVVASQWFEAASFPLAGAFLAPSFGSAFSAPVSCSLTAKFGLLRN